MQNSIPHFRVTIHYTFGTKCPEGVKKRGAAQDRSPAHQDSLARRDVSTNRIEGFTSRNSPVAES